MRILICSLLVTLAFAACQPTTQDPPQALPPVSLAVTQDKVISVITTKVPTANPLPSRTATVPPTNTNTPTITLVPTLTLTPSLTPTITNTPSPTLFPTNTRQATDTLTPSATFSPTEMPTSPGINTPTPGANTDANGTPLPTWTPPPRNASVEIADHYTFHRPISQDGIDYLDRTYPYGGTAGNSKQVHHGVDMENPTGTPILAAGDGTVYYAGNDFTTVFGAYPNYYGNLVVIQHNFTTSDGKPVFTLYGHMSSVGVQTGQAVKTGQVIGFVGSTGIAQGPHLHFEVRVGEPHDFNNSTRNPDLWLFPFQGFGTLAGRVTDANGTILYQATVQVRSRSSKVPRYTWTYPDNTVTSDDTFHENFTLGDLPANYYEVSVNDGQRVRFDKLIYVYPNRTTWIDIQLNN